MLETFPTPAKMLTAQHQIRRQRTGYVLWLAVLVGATGVFGGLMLVGGAAPAYIAWACYLLGIVAIVWRPRYGVYLMLGLSLLGDAVLTPWYPFTKNFSSPESLLFFSNSFSFTPLETYLALTMAVWLLQLGMRRDYKLYIGRLVAPIAVFTLFVTASLLYGLATRGDRTIALWEVRSMFYLLPFVLLVSNLVQTRAHVNVLLWMIIVPLALDAISGVWYVATILNFNLAGVEAIAEHSLSIHFNAFFVLLLAVWLFPSSSAKRLTLTCMSPVVLLAYIANNRRASFIALGIAVAILAIVLYRRYRFRFWLIVPAASVLATVYTAAFWNSSGALGSPAKAVRSVIGTPDPRDASSNLYRVYENINILYTIKSNPIFGTGFGHKFNILISMADISVFQWWEYITHNSVLWIWMNAGIGGFLSLLVVIGMSIALGARSLWRMPDNEMAVAALLALCYIIMHFIFAYVDMSWDAVNMTLLGVMIGLVNCLPHIVAKTVEPAEKRWPWQPDAALVPGLRAMAES